MASIGLPLILPRVPQDNLELHEAELNRHRQTILATAIRTLEAEDERCEDPDEAIKAALVKAKLMDEYRDLLDRTRDTQQAPQLMHRMNAFDHHLRLQALRAQRLELYRMRKEDQLDDDLLAEILRELDIAEARLHK
jgi:hypothetical protein